jgi:hypothetical protein
VCQNGLVDRQRWLTFGWRMKMNIGQWQCELNELFACSPELQEALAVVEEAERQYEMNVVTRLSGYKAPGTTGSASAVRCIS